MKKLFLFLNFLSVLTFAQTLQCRTTCQHWDDFARHCDYATRCEIGTTLARYYYCERFDSFSRQCLSEITQVQSYNVNPYAAVPSCTERCQYFDNFSGKCLYRTTCAYSSYILKFTECEKWDSFSEHCDFEQSHYYWNVY